MPTGNPGVPRLDGRPVRTKAERIRETAREFVEAQDRGLGADFYVQGRLVAIAEPPGRYDWPRVWTARDCEGRAVAYYNREAAECRAQAYAEQWATRNVLAVA